MQYMFNHAHHYISLNSNLVHTNKIFYHTKPKNSNKQDTQQTKFDYHTFSVPAMHATSYSRLMLDPSSILHNKLSSTVSILPHGNWKHGVLGVSIPRKCLLVEATSSMNTTYVDDV